MEFEKVTYLTNACGETTGYGTLILTEDEFKKVAFEDGPGNILPYIVEIEGVAYLMGNFEVFHKSDFWCGNDDGFLQEEEAESFCEEAGKVIDARLVPGMVRVDLEFGDPGRFVIGVAMPLHLVNDMEHGKALLSAVFEGFAGVERELCDAQGA